MPNITDNLLSLESELTEIVKKTAALKQEIGDFSQAREDLLTVRDRLEGVIASLDTLLHAQHDTILAIRQTAPDKILEEISKFNGVVDSVRKEIENLDEEFIAVKDLVLTKIDTLENNLKDLSVKIKDEITNSIRNLYDKYQLMADKLYVADDKILVTQERLIDLYKKHEESTGKNKKEIKVIVIIILLLVLISLVMLGKIIFVK